MGYVHFIGIDVSQGWFDVAVDGSATKPARFSNDAAGFAACKARFAAEWPTALIVLEATGFYEMALLRFLVREGAMVHRAMPLMVKNFIRSLGRQAKTDAIDAIGLARFARERHEQLALFGLPGETQSAINDLLMRRNDLVAMAAAEKARATQPRYKDAAGAVLRSLRETLAFVAAQIAALEAAIEALVAASGEMQARLAAMTSLKGVGTLTAWTLQAFMPELGRLNRRQAASLAGCAPHPRDSGAKSRHRSVFGGRATLKRALFLVAMSARRFEPDIRAFFERLVANGKPKMVALTACMRKIITILNARLRQCIPQTTR